jgi:exodeoxyribonuclease VII large subunit
LDQIATTRERLVRAVRYKILMCARDLQQRGAERAEAVVHRALARRQQRIDDLDFALRAQARGLLAIHRKKLDEYTQKLRGLDLRLRFAQAHSRLNAAESQLAQLARGSVWRARHRYESLAAHIAQLSPLAILGRGYAIVQDERGRILRNADEAHRGELVNVRLSEGRIEARVERTDKSL